MGVALPDVEVAPPPRRRALTGKAEHVSKLTDALDAIDTGMGLTEATYLRVCALALGEIAAALNREPAVEVALADGEHDAVPPCGAYAILRYTDMEPADMRWCSRRVGPCPFRGASTLAQLSRFDPDAKEARPMHDRHCARSMEEA